MSAFSGFDIFGVPLEYLSMDARKHHWAPYIDKLSKHLQVDITKTFKVSVYDIYQSVFLGYLSFQSASYFLLSRFTLLQDDYLASFIDFIHSNPTMSVAKIRVLWQGQKSVPENTFLFPLEEPDCSKTDEQLAAESVSYLRREWISNQQDLPEDFPF